MIPRPLPIGAPGSDLGYAHALKHWMNPREMWEDIADGVPDEARPRAAWERWSALGVDPVAEAKAPGPTLTARWAEVEPAWSDGYLATICRLLAPLADPPTGWAPRPDKARWAVHPGEGVVVEVQLRRGEWELYTAYRACDFKLPDYRCPPRDAASVSLRRTLALNAARKRVASFRGQGRNE
jgi:hypothetical protein